MTLKLNNKKVSTLNEALNLVEETDFVYLFDKTKKLISFGYKSNILLDAQVQLLLDAPLQNIENKQTFINHYSIYLNIPVLIINFD